MQQPENIKKFARQLLGEFEKLWSIGSTHGDAHGGNIIIQPDGSPVLIDFGRAKEMNDNTRSDALLRKDLMTIGHTLLILAMKNPKVRGTKINVKGDYPLSQLLPPWSYKVEENKNLENFINNDKDDGYSELRAFLRDLYHPDWFKIIDPKTIDLIKNHSYLRDS